MKNPFLVNPDAIAAYYECDYKKGECSGYTRNPQCFFVSNGVCSSFHSCAFVMKEIFPNIERKKGKVAEQ